MTDKLKYMINGENAVCVGRTPGRGFYHIYTYELNTVENEDDWIWCLRREETMALILIDIGAASTRALNEYEIDKLDRILTLFEENDFKMIVRIVYDRLGNGMMSEPKDPIIIFRHMMQTGAVLRKYSSQILTVQGLFAGSWGEMHSSKFMGEENLVLFYKRLRKALGDDICISVRRPDMIELVKKTMPEEKIGLFDDAILGSGNDLGTWEGTLSTQDIEKIKLISNEGPVSGEIMAGAKDIAVELVDEHLAMLGVTCLDSVYDAESVDYLKKNGLGDKLGYKYEVSKTGGSTYLVKNVGYAPAYIDLEVEIYDDDSLEKIAEIIIPAFDIKSGEEKEYNI